MLCETEPRNMAFLWAAFDHTYINKIYTKKKENLSTSFYFAIVYIYVLCIIKVVFSTKKNNTHVHTRHRTVPRYE